LRFAERATGPILESTITDYMQLLNSNNYAKAGWVLHMLRCVVGDEKFWQGLAAYYQQFKNGNALSSDFQAVMEKASGYSLEWFFTQWLEQPGYPQLAVQWRWEEARKEVELSIDQVQERTFFRLPMEVALYSKQAAKTHSLWLENKAATITIPHEHAPERLVIDPDGKILMTVEPMNTTAVTTGGSR
jgi:aminopeptidase N